MSGQLSRHFLFILPQRLFLFFTGESTYSRPFTRIASVFISQSLSQVVTTPFRFPYRESYPIHTGYFQVVPEVYYLP